MAQGLPAPSPLGEGGVRGFRSQKKASGPLALSRRERGQHKCFWDRFLELNLAPMAVAAALWGTLTAGLRSQARPWRVRRGEWRRLADAGAPEVSLVAAGARGYAHTSGAVDVCAGGRGGTDA